jgi:hypothetical protein
MTFAWRLAEYVARMGRRKIFPKFWLESNIIVEDLRTIRNK